MDAESIRRIHVSSRVLWHFSKVNADPITPTDADALRALAETEDEKFMALDDLACIVIRRAVGPAENQKLNPFKNSPALRFIQPSKKRIGRRYLAR